jgi:hypothetical protein
MNLIERNKDLNQGIIEEMTAIRKKVNEYHLSRNSIDKLMTEKVDEMIVVKEQPLPVQVGRKIIMVGNFTFENENLFFRKWAKILGAIYAIKGNLELGIGLLGDGAKLYQILHNDTKLFKMVCKLIEKTILKQQEHYMEYMDKRIKVSWDNNCSIKYFRKHVETEELIQICMLIYLYNFDAVKKNIGVVGKNLNIQQGVETYMYYWLQNLAGTTGEYLLRQAPSIDSVFNDSETVDSVSSLKEQKKAS